MSWFARLSLATIILVILGAIIHAYCQRPPSTARWRCPFCSKKTETTPSRTNAAPRSVQRMLEQGEIP